MLSFFKSSKKKPQQKGRAFYERENLIQTIDELNDILAISDNENLDVTNNKILFHGKELDEIKLADLEDLLGETSFVFNPDNSIEGHEVYYFRLKSEHLKFLIQVHFIDDEFFLAGTKIYSDTLLSKNDKQRVVQQIVDKYGQKGNGITEFMFKGSEGNILWTNDDVFFHINYLKCEGMCEKLKKKYYGISKPKPGQEIKDTLDSLI